MIIIAHFPHIHGFINLFHRLSHEATHSKKSAMMAAIVSALVLIVFLSVDREYCVALRVGVMVRGVTVEYESAFAWTSFTPRKAARTL